jgi:hypothetical protein
MGRIRSSPYPHDDAADQAYLKKLAQQLAASGWERAKRKLRTFHHTASQYEIELEPGGSETSGHFLHFMRRNRSCGWRPRKRT